MDTPEEMLKRRSNGFCEQGAIHSMTVGFAELDLVSRREKVPENKLRVSTKEDDNENTLAIVMNKIDELTTEKTGLELTVSELLRQLERVTEDYMSLQCTCEELTKSLDLERMRFKRLEKFYERKIQHLTTGNQQGQSIEDSVDGNDFYEETIKSLVLVQETQAEEMSSLKKNYEENLKSLSLEHEAGVSEILESSNFQVQKLMQENEAVVQDLLRGCEQLFEQLKNEYNKDTETDGKFKSAVRKNIIVQFKALPPRTKIVVVAGIVVINIAAGWAGWGFIVWMWPRLIAFAEVVASDPGKYVTLLYDFLTSAPFQQFIQSWEEGKSLRECLKAFANTDFIMCALRLAPGLFNRLKNSQRQPVG